LCFLRKCKDRTVNLRQSYLFRECITKVLFKVWTAARIRATYTVFLSLIQFPLSKDSFITPASIFMISRSLFPLLLNKDCFITPASVYTAFLSSLQILFIQGVAVPGSGGQSPLTRNMRNCLISQKFEAGRKSIDWYYVRDIFVRRYFC